MEIREEFRNQRPHQVLQKGTVKELEQKIRNFELGKPSIFIGSSRESLYIAEKVKSLFGDTLFEVDIWDEGVFGKTPSSERGEDPVTGRALSNVEWLKNFTDIYDYAMFLFVPEDKIVSETRVVKNDQGKEIVTMTLGTRHNVVFEFGMFLGRIGAKKTFVLFDKGTTDFIKLFFTDIIENLLDPYDSSYLDPSANYISLYPYESDSNLGSQGASAILDRNLKIAVEKIKKEILLNLETIEITFLPSTTLAIGYFNNFIKIFVENINFLRGFSLLDSLEQKNKLEEIMSKEALNRELRIINSLIKAKGNIMLKIVIPNSLDGAVQNQFTPKFNKEIFKQEEIFGVNRNLTIDRLRNSEKVLQDSLIFYDVPTTMNSSIEALEIINPHKDIKELLSEKERQNFKKVLDFKIAECERSYPEIRKNVEIISWSQFLTEIGQVG